MDIDALQLACRFALPPNSLGYCGQDSAPEKFKRCVISNECEGVEEEISKFIVFYPYLKTISEITNLPVFSYKVIESYCLGNELLRKVKSHHYEILLKNFAEQGVPDWLIQELRQKPPKLFIPHHLFQVLHVGVGRASGAVPFNTDTINQCMIRWGKVRKIAENEATIELNSLKETGQGYELTMSQETHPIIPEFVPDLRIGDTVAVHWKQVIKKLTPDEEKNLTYWTKKTLKVLS